ncbi:nucleobindin SSP120 SKDI_12G2840 [Saccharomyces kudriavzevii IFO 1802]|uniref:SSP120-like protein n=2 Tax=Saccharomyces kudriavzevii (strain ATCC MYA-4449 / AS 2.2408 / CBS 8840 / NBRC 1802 / NCYC 2889) TaxID=226230 RepID=J6EBX5_SACK1|nr:uncharacterized protein SKDI_12G2840 [Saccharomyces kudriavzevii IFO 1802]EJT41859.1 SSP120-like protein [Saccharomyces kudriavzevii IFO 1802]CAI4046552.1 hypothetical protein SKDI_12G2840 [Saccharomyces kudriavzevii IFO 1802]
MRLSWGFIFSLVFSLYKVNATAELGSDINVENEKPPEGLSWEEWHMDHEHQLKDYTPEIFFALHDVKKKGYLDANDILSLYGLNREEVVGTGDGMGQHDESEKVDNSMAERAVDLIMTLFDLDDDMKITKKEYLEFAGKKGRFPDIGVGVGHHSDFELEYEIHHWNKFHKDKDPQVKVVHKEDIEHELLHHEHEIEHEEEVQRGASRSTVITDDELESRIKLENIPEKFKNGIF